MLFDNELEEAVVIIRNLWNEGIDALLFRIWAVEMNLPPVPLFASTQTHNNTWQKVQFLEKVWFQRVILARELSIREINEISKKLH